jgi:hypothetical protein
MTVFRRYLSSMLRSPGSIALDTSYWYGRTSTAVSTLTADPTVPDGTGMNSHSAGGAASPPGMHVLARHFVGPVPKTGTLQGYVDHLFYGRQQEGANDAYASLRVRVLSADGTIVRGVLFEGVPQGSGLEFPVSVTSAGGSAGRRVGGRLTPVHAVQATDLLCVEPGMHRLGSGTSGMYVYEGSTGSTAPDLTAEGQLQSAGGRTWIDFDFREPPGTPLDLTAAGTALAWLPPIAGDAPTSYEVQVIGQTGWVDVGNVTGYTLDDNLAPETTYAVQVRAVNEWGSSAPAEVSVTTPSGAAYRVTVELGGRTWHAAAGDPPALGVALPLSFGWAMSDDAAGYPAQLEPGTASLLLVIPDGTDLAGIDVGTPMRVRVWRTAGPPARPFATFTGRVADYEIGPHPRGIAVRLLGTDYTMDLAGGGTVGAVEWPAESGDARAARIMGEAGHEWVSDPIGNVFEDRAAQPAPAANVLRESLTAAARVATGAYSAPGRVILTPDVDDAGTLAGFRGTFTAAESVAIDNVPTAVHRATTWRRNRITDGRWVHIDHPGGPTVYGDVVSGGSARPRLAVPVYDTDALADLALAVVPGFSWLSGAPLRLDLSAPDAVTPADWFWRDAASPAVPGAGRVVVVKCDALPGMFSEYAGMLAAVQLTLEPGGRMYVDFRLRPDVPAYSTVTPRWIDEPPVARWADELDTATWFELRTIDRADYLEYLTP